VQAGWRCQQFEAVIEKRFIELQGYYCGTGSCNELKCSTPGWRRLPVFQAKKRPPVGVGSPAIPGSCGLDDFLDEFGQLGLGQGADLGGLGVSVLEHYQGGDAADAELGRNTSTGISEFSTSASNVASLTCTIWSDIVFSG
jgi:hypothetical protein